MPTTPSSGDSPTASRSRRGFAVAMLAVPVAVGLVFWLTRAGAAPGPVEPDVDPATIQGHAFVTPEDDAAMTDGPSDLTGPIAVGGDPLTGDISEGDDEPIDPDTLEFVSIGDTIPIDFPSLSCYHFEPLAVPPREAEEAMKHRPDQIPTAIKGLNGKRVSIPGFIKPTGMKDNKVRHLMLMENQSLCCFGIPIRLNQWIDVTVPESEAFNPDWYLHMPIYVVGALEVGEVAENGWTLSVYRMTADRVFPPGEMPELDFGE